MSYRDTRIWQSAFEPANSDTKAAQEARRRLKGAYERMREKASVLLEDIGRWLPWYTVHDITHIDALWECADKIVGPEYVLTPTETFVLGGGFLYHDAAMTLAAYDGSVDKLRDSNVDLWNAVVAQKLRHAGFDEPGAVLMSKPPEEILQDTIRELLRRLHADRAHDLPSLQLTSGKHRLSLIEDEDVREEFADAIGQVAASHHWSVERVGQTFGDDVPGAPASFPCPPEWRCDLLKVACLLRVSDASHIDSRRAPSFLAAIRRPEGVSALHWQFQGRLKKFGLDHDALVYSVKSPFAPSEAAAWWLAYDAIQMIDGELRAVDALLATYRSDESRFAARLVRYAGSPVHLAQSIKVQGWVPVDARIRIGNVTEVIRRFGGEQLYGANPTVAVRELLQNAFDAVLARRADENLNEDFGDVEIAIEPAHEQNWRLSIVDNGIGMNQAVLKRYLLDFGASLWNSAELVDIHPKLAASNFRPTGRFGIGFFSVFMLGDTVTVVTKPYNEGYASTSVLEFTDGLEGRPIVRLAQEGELSAVTTTKVSVVLKPAVVDRWLYPDPMQRFVRYHHRHLPRDVSRLAQDLESECIRLCVAAPVTVRFRSPDKTTTLCRGNDWITIDQSQLILRVRAQQVGFHTSASIVAKREGVSSVESVEAGNDVPRHHRLLPIHGIDPTTGAKLSIIGRLGVDRGNTSRKDGAALAGCFPAVALDYFCGIIQGTPTRLSRDAVRIDASKTDISEWATTVGELLAGQLKPYDELQIGLQLLILGGRPCNLKLFLLPDGAYSCRELQDALREWRMFKLITRDLLPDGRALYGAIVETTEIDELKELRQFVRMPARDQIWCWDLKSTRFAERELFENLEAVEPVQLMREAVDRAWGAGNWTQTPSTDGAVVFAR